MRYRPPKIALILFAMIALAWGLTVVVSNARRGFSQVAQTNPSNAKDYYARGRAYIGEQNWDRAISDLTEAIRLNPKDALAHECRGCCYLVKQDADNALDDFNQAIQLGWTNSSVYQNRGNAYRAKRQCDEAIADFTESLRSNPTSDIAYKCRAAVYEVRDELDTAISDWNKGLRLNPNDASALAGRGWTYFRKGEFEKALRDYREAIQVDPKNEAALCNLGWLRGTCPDARLRDGKEAVEAATKACELAKRWQNVDTLAAAFAEAGDFNRAIEYQKQAMELEGVSDQGRERMRQRLFLYQQQRPYREGDGTNNASLPQP